MNGRWLKQRLTVAPIVLALWAGNAMGFGDPLCFQGPECLFRLSIEELMEVPIDSVCSRSVYERDSLEAPVPKATVTSFSYERMNRRITSDGTEASLTLIRSDNVDYARDQDEK